MKSKARATVYAKDAVHVTARLSDFDGDLQKWKNSVYDLFRLNMTWSFAHKIDVCESRMSGVYVYLAIKPSYEKQLVAAMGDLGFQEIKAQHEDIGAIDFTELPEDMLIDFAVVE